MLKRLSSWLESQAKSGPVQSVPELPKAEVINGHDVYAFSPIQLLDAQWAEELRAYIDDPAWSVAYTVGWGKIRRTVAPGITARVYIGWALSHPTEGLILRLQKQVLQSSSLAPAIDPLSPAPSVSPVEKLQLANLSELESVLEYWGLRIGPFCNAAAFWQSWYAYHQQIKQQYPFAI